MDLKILQYELEFDTDAQRSITLERVYSPTGDRWAIRRGSECLDKVDVDGWYLFMIEPIPSSRDASFYNRCRWSSADEALIFWRANRRRIPATVMEQRRFFETSKGE